MTTQLQPQTLDIEITKITPKRVYYKLWANGVKKCWRIPSNSTFDTSQLVIGARYIVDSDVVIDRQWNYIERKWKKVQSFEWVTATPVVTPIKLQARTQKQRKAAEALAAMAVVDDGTLFSWQPKPCLTA